MFGCKVHLGGFAVMQLELLELELLQQQCVLASVSFQSKNTSWLLRRNENKRKELIAIMGTE